MLSPHLRPMRHSAADKGSEGMVNISDVANRANVSAMTVSRVTNNSGYVKAETRERVLRAMEELNYHPNYLARSLV